MAVRQCMVTVPSNAFAVGTCSGRHINSRIIGRHCGGIQCHSLPSTSAFDRTVFGQRMLTRQEVWRRVQEEHVLRPISYPTICMCALPSLAFAVQPRRRPSQTTSRVARTLFHVHHKSHHHLRIPINPPHLRPKQHILPRRRPADCAVLPHSRDAHSSSSHIRPAGARVLSARGGGDALVAAAVAGALGGDIGDAADGAVRVARAAVVVADGARGAVAHDVVVVSLRRGGAVRWLALCGKGSRV